MKKLLASLSALALVSSVASAQTTAPRMEFGVDMTAGVMTGGGATIFALSTPVDVRAGFLSPGNMNLEARFSLALLSGSGTTIISVDPGLNVLWKLRPGTGPNRQYGPYLTFGADVDITSISGGGSSTDFGINAGIGTRMGTSATHGQRLEGFVGYRFDSEAFMVGVRAGLSFFK